MTRQSGKNIWLEVVEFASIVLFKDRLIVHSAHRADVSHEHFLSLKEHIESCDDLMEAMPTWKPNNGFITTNGNESIELANGARILFKARAKASGRGPRPQKIVFDEALVLEQSQVGAQAPGITAQRNPQIIFASSSPLRESEVLHSLRARAEEAEEGDRLFYAAWNNPPDTGVTDRDAMYRVNPSLGCGRMTEESLLANRKLMSTADFLRGHFGVPEEPAEDDSDAIIQPEIWANLADPDSTITHSQQIALDVSSPDRRWASFGAAGKRADGHFHIEAFDSRPGTAWVLERGVELWRRHRCPIRIQTGSPAASFIADLVEAGVKVEEVTERDHAQALGRLLDAVHAGTIHHLGGSNLTKAVERATLRSSGDVELWGRRKMKFDVTPLVAVTLALGGVAGKPPPYTKAAEWRWWADGTVSPQARCARRGEALRLA